MKNSEEEQFKQLVQGGMAKFIFYRGVLLFGLTTFLITQFTNQQGFTVPEFTLNLLGVLLLFLAGGALVGFVFWFVVSAKYDASRK